MKIKYKDENGEVVSKDLPVVELFSEGKSTISHQELIKKVQGYLPAVLVKLKVNGNAITASYENLELNEDVELEAEIIYKNLWKKLPAEIDFFILQELFVSNSQQGYGESLGLQAFESLQKTSRMNFVVLNHFVYAKRAREFCRGF